MVESSGRGVNLIGEAALAWFVARGVEADPPTGAPPRIAADYFRDQALAITRIWHTPLTLKMPSGDSSSVKLVLMLDGYLEISTDGETVVLKKDQILLLEEEYSQIFRSTESSARIELRFNSMQSLHPYLVSTIAHGDILERSGMSDVLAGLITLIFTAGISPKDIGWSHTSRLIIEAISAMLANSSKRLRSQSASSANSRLYHRALDVIHEEYVRVEFSVELLTQILKTSPTRLREAFKVHGTTAREMIRASRAAHARKILESGNFTSREDLEHIARMAGFPSARAMAEALKRIE